jgi:hypothetical protein
VSSRVWIAGGIVGLCSSWMKSESQKEITANRLSLPYYLVNSTLVWYVG